MSNNRQKITFASDGYAPRLKRIQQISKLLDNAVTIPGTPVGIGLDPLIGLIPVGGDVLGMIFSLYIVIESAQLGVSKSTLARMIVNVIIDALVGAFTVLGDLFDVAWTANKYNLNLLEDYLKSPGEKKQADKSFIITLIIGLVLLGVALVSLPVLIMGILWKALTGG